MKLRDPRPQQPGAPSDAAAATAPGRLNEVRGEGERLLAAADDAIKRTISGNSQKFLRAVRQHGGE